MSGKELVKERVRMALQGAGGGVADGVLKEVSHEMRF